MLFCRGEHDSKLDAAGIAGLGVLFAVAYVGDLRSATPRWRWARPLIYALATAVIRSNMPRANTDARC
jgi:hypothetical protein